MQIRRSILSVPGDKSQMFSKAFSSKADCIQFDMEDSISAESKCQARELIIDYLNTNSNYEKLISLRINSIHSGFVLEDLIAFEAVILNKIDYLVIPKIESKSDVIFIDTYIKCIENKNNIISNVKLDICIESAQALNEINEITASSSRISGLVFGVADFSESMEIDINSISGHGEELDKDSHSLIDYALNSLAITAKANGLEAIDAPFGDYQNNEMLVKSSKIARMKGFNGKWAIHPAQIEIINTVFTPSTNSIQNAQLIIELFEKAISEGKASISYNGKMIDIATYSLAKSTLQKVTNGNS